MRRKFLAGLMMLSMTASLFSNVGYTSVNAAEYETNVNTSAEAEDEVAATEEVTTEDAITETVSTEEVLTEDSTTEEDNMDSIEEELYDTSEEEIVSTGNIVDSGQYGTCSWSIDENGVLLVDGVVTRSRSDWPWSGNSQITAAKITGSGEGSLNGMFYGCNNLTTIDLSAFNTSNVTSMGVMFCNCEKLSTIDLSNFDTGNVTTMSGMFYGCREASSIDVSNFNTGKVTNMSSMFFGCNNLSSVDVSNFDTGSVTDMNVMFSDCENLSSIDVSNFDTGNVTNMWGMFYGCKGVSSIDVSNFNTEKVTDMGSMFASCENISSIDVSNFITKNVTYMGNMFYGCKKASSIDVSKFDTENVTYMRGMFSGCGSLGSIDVSNFDTSSVIDMYGMFGECSSISSLNLSNFDTSSVTDMGSMFYGCSSLISLDLSNFNLGKVTSGSYMFTGCNSLTEMKAPYNISLNIEFPTVAGYTWIDGDNNEVSVMRQNCPTAITYQRKPISYTIHFDKNTATSGSMKRVYPKYGRNYRLPACGFKKPGYTFAGWNTRKDGKGTTYKNQSNVKNLTTTNGKVVVLYAQWRKISLSTPAKPTLGNYAAGRLTVTCKAVKGADGYLIQYSTNKNMKNAKTVSSTTLKKNIYKLKKGTTYYVRVRAYKVDSAGKKVCGKYSGVQAKKLTK